MQNGVTLEMAETWEAFYQQTHAANPNNLSAKGRVELMRCCIELLQEQH